MRNIMKSLKEVILKKRIHMCELRIINLDAKSDNYYNMIIGMIRNGENKVKIERLKLKREKVNIRVLELIHKKYSFRKRLLRA